MVGEIVDGFVVVEVGLVNLMFGLGIVDDKVIMFVGFDGKIVVVYWNWMNYWLLWYCYWLCSVVV